MASSSQKTGSFGRQRRKNIKNKRSWNSCSSSSPWTSLKKGPNLIIKAFWTGISVGWKTAIERWESEALKGDALDVLDALKGEVLDDLDGDILEALEGELEVCVASHQNLMTSVSKCELAMVDCRKNRWQALDRGGRGEDDFWKKKDSLGSLNRVQADGYPSGVGGVDASWHSLSTLSIWDVHGYISVQKKGLRPIKQRAKGIMKSEFELLIIFERLNDLSTTLGTIAWLTSVVERNIPSEFRPLGKCQPAT